MEKKVIEIKNGQSLKDALGPELWNEFCHEVARGIVEGTPAELEGESIPQSSSKGKVKEKMVDLKIKVPARWAAFIDDFYKITGMDRDEDMRSTVKANIEGLMLSDDYLSTKDRIRLVEKHHLSDIYEIPQWLRDDAAGVPRPVQPEDPTSKAAGFLADNPRFRESFSHHMRNAEEEAIITAIKALSPDEIKTVKGLMPA